MINMYVLIVALLSGEITILPYKSWENCQTALQNFQEEIPKKDLDYIECQKATVTKH